MASVYEQYTAPAGEGGLFTKLEDGNSVKLRIMSEPYIFTSQFKEGDPIRTRYAWVVYNYNENRGEVLALGVTAFRNIQSLASDSDWGDPTQYDIKITRTGQKFDTKYNVTPNPKKTALSGEMQEAVKSVDIKKVIPNCIPLEQVVGGAELPAPAVSGKESSTPAGDVVIENLDEEVDLSSIPF